MVRARALSWFERERYRGSSVSAIVVRTQLGLELRTFLIGLGGIVAKELFEAARKIGIAGKTSL